MQLEGSCVRLFLFSFGFRISFSELVFVCRYGDSFSGSLGIRYGHLLQRKKVASALKLLVFSAEEPSIIDLRPYGDAERENNMNETYITTELLAQYAHKLYEEEKSSATIQKYIRDVRTFSKYAGSQALTKDLTIAYILSPATVKNRPDHRTFQSVPGSDRSVPQHRCFPAQTAPGIAC